MNFLKKRDKGSAFHTFCAAKFSRWRATPGAEKAPPVYDRRGFDPGPSSLRGRCLMQPRRQPGKQNANQQSLPTMRKSRSSWLVKPASLSYQSSSLTML